MVVLGTDTNDLTGEYYRTKRYSLVSKTAVLMVSDNLIDGLDGLAAGTMAIASVAFFLYSQLRR